MDAQSLAVAAFEKIRHQEARPKPLRYCNYRAALELYKTRVDEYNALVTESPDSRTLRRLLYLRLWIDAALQEARAQ